MNLSKINVYVVKNQSNTRQKKLNQGKIECFSKFYQVKSMNIKLSIEILVGTL